MNTLDRFVGLNKIVLVSPDKKETVTKAGIIIPDTARGRRARAVSGTVVKAAEENKVKKGYTVWFREGLGTEVLLDDKTYLLLNEGELMCGVQPS
jgi:co-chaperonin GroES (HSP10)